MTRIRDLFAGIRQRNRALHPRAKSKVHRFRRMRITLESERLLVVIHQNGMERWCEECEASVRMVGLEQAMSIADESRSAILHKLEQRQLHFAEIGPAELLICLNSLLKRMQSGD